MKADSAKHYPDIEKDGLVDRKLEISLVQAAICGDADSFTEICQYYYPAMVAIAHSITGDRHLAEDAAQQTFAKAAVKLPQLKVKEKFAGWIATICRNTAKDIFRKQRIFSDADELSTVAAKKENVDQIMVVREALTKLSDPAREVIYLRFYDGLSYEQISSVLGISEQAINGRLRRAKKELAEYLRREGFNECQL